MVSKAFNDDKFILDAAAGFRMMWFNKKHPNTIYLDNRPECEPDIIGDFRDLKQFPDETFKLIVFDPPHLIWMGKQNPLRRSFGILNKETWPVDFKLAFQELWRILKPMGILIFKWNDRDIPWRKVAQFFPTTPLFANITAKTIRHDTRRVRSRTRWFCFMKIPKQMRLLET